MSTWTIPEYLQAEIRRVLGFPDRLSSASIQLGYPNFASELMLYQPYAVLEAKLTYLESSPEEAVPIFGAAHPQFSTFYASAMFSFAISTPSTIVNGAEMTVTFDGTTATATAAADTPTSFAAKLATAMKSAFPTLVSGAVSGTTTSISTVVGADGNGLAISAVSSDPSLLVNGSIVTGGVLSGGTDPPGPYIPIDGQTFAIYGYLPCIQLLESDLGYERRNLSASMAADVTLNPVALGERNALLRRYRRELADRFSVPLDPDIAGNRKRASQRVR